MEKIEVNHQFTMHYQLIIVIEIIKTHYVQHSDISCSVTNIQAQCWIVHIKYIIKDKYGEKAHRESHKYWK